MLETCRLNTRREETSKFEMQLVKSSLQTYSGNNLTINSSRRKSVESCRNRVNLMISCQHVQEEAGETKPKDLEATGEGNSR